MDLFSFVLYGRLFGVEVWVALMTSSTLRETALLCISIRELISRGWIISRLQTGLIFTGLAGTERTISVMDLEVGIHKLLTVMVHQSWAP